MLKKTMKLLLLFFLFIIVSVTTDTPMYHGQTNEVLDEDTIMDSSSKYQTYLSYDLKKCTSVNTVFKRNFEIASASLEKTDTKVPTTLTNLTAVSIGTTQSVITWQANSDHVVVTDTEAPSIPTNITAVTSRTTQSVITWTPSTDNVAVTEYHIYRDGINIGTTDHTNYTDTGLSASTTYTYTIKASDAAGNQSEASSELVVITKSLLSVPENIVGIPSTTTIQLNWDIVEGAECYDLKINDNLISDMTGSTYKFFGLYPNTSYEISIRAKSSEQISEWSTIITLMTLENTEIGGTIHSNTTLTIDNSPYTLTQDLIIPENITLTIEPGVIIKGTSYHISINVAGQLETIGTESNPIIMTTINDESYGGSGVTNEYTHWEGIRIETTGELIGEYVKIRYGGGNASWSSSQTDGSNVYVLGNIDLSHSEISSAYYYGFYIATQQQKNIRLTNNLIESNKDKGIYLQRYNTGILDIKENKINNNTNSGIAIDFSEIKGGDLTGIRNNTYEGNQYNGMSIMGDVTTDLTLPQTDYYLEQDVTIQEGNKLVLEPGIVIKSTSYHYSINVAGQLEAIGTESNPIVMTTINDESYGGNGVTNEYTHWEGIRIETTGELIGEYVKIRYGGGNASWSSSQTDGSNVYVLGNIDLSHSEISSAYYYGFYIATQQQKNIRLTNNLIESNKYEGIYLQRYNTGILDIKENKINNNTNSGIAIDFSEIKGGDLTGIRNNTYEGNQYNGMSIRGDVTTDLTLPQTDYYLVQDVTIQEGNKLVLEPGVIIKGTSYDNGISVAGQLEAIGTESNPIVMTTINDDSYGGSGVTNQYTYWDGLRIETTGEVLADNIKVRYGGSGIYSNNNYSNIYVLGYLNLINSEISHSYNYGLRFNTNVLPLLKYNTLMDNKNIGLNNTNEAITIDAEYNYWNSIYGPSKYVYNSIEQYWEWVGSGDKVSSHVDYTPYLGEELKIKAHFSKNTGTYAPTGNYSRSFTDLHMNYLDDTISITRNYNSLDNQSTSVFGQGWTFNYQASISSYENNENIKMVTLPDGSTVSFTRNTDGTYTSNNSRHTLIKEFDNSYVLTTKEQKSYGYNTQGYLTWIKDKYENTINIHVDNDGKVLNITDDTGRTYTLTYENDRLKAITDPIGRTVTYGYQDNLLKTVLDPLGATMHYSYDSEGYLSEIKDDQLNIIESIVYDHINDRHRVSQTTDKYGNTKAYHYNDQNGKTTITDNNNRQFIQWYDYEYSIINTVDPEGQATLTEYFENEGMNQYNEIKSYTNRNGNTTTYERDNNGNMTKIIHPDSSYQELNYDDKNNIISQRDEEGQWTYFIYDSSGTYLAKKIQPLNGTDTYSDSSDPSRYAIETYTYYQEGENGYTLNGLLKSSTNPEGNTILYTYDRYGNIQTVTNAEGNTITYQNNQIGWKTETQSAEGYVTQYRYDFNGNLEKTIQDSGETTRMIYDTLGRKVQEIRPNQYNGALDNMSSHTYNGDHGYRYTYYSNGELHTIKDPEDNMTTYTYDIYGNVISEKKPNDAVYEYTYDLLNRPTHQYFKEALAANRVLLETYAYTILSDGKEQKTHTVYYDDTHQSVTVYTYDYAARLIEQKNPDGSTLQSSYYQNGNKYSQTDAKGQTTYYHYDFNDRVTELWSPFDNNQYTYTLIEYDKAGNKSAEHTGDTPVILNDTSPSFISKYYTYNKNNQVVAVTDDEGRKTEYSYDKDGNKVEEVVYVDQNQTIVTAYDYNHFGKPNQKTQYVHAGDLYGHHYDSTKNVAMITTYSYDKNGNLKEETNPKGITTTYTYDTMDRPLTISQPGQDEYGQSLMISTSKTYNWEGHPLTQVDANGNVTTYQYNKRGLLEKLIDAQDGVAAFYYDRAGRTIAEVSPNNYQSDKELTDMTRVVYTYDNKNQVILKEDVYQEPVSNKWITITSTAFQYDANGNVIKQLDALGYESGTGSTIKEKIDTGYGIHYTYNDANQVLTVCNPETKDKGLAYTSMYTYDTLGRKLSETNAKGVITLYDYDTVGNVLKVCIKEDGSGPEQIVSLKTYDYLNHVLTQTDANGNTISFEYNKLNKLRKQTLPGDATISGNAVIYQYDELGNLRYQKTDTDIVDVFTYDNQGNELSHTHQMTDGSETITTRVSYDKNSNIRFETNGKGDVKAYTYNALNKIKTKSIVVSDIEHLTTYTYDKNNNLTTEKDWRGNTYTNIYDSLNRLVEKQDPYAKTIEKIEYDKNHNQVKSYDALNNLTQYTYDKNNRLIKTTDPEGYEVIQAYDEVGNLASKIDGEGNKTLYDYDYQNNLKCVTNAKDEKTSYTYDLNGNKLTQTDGSQKVITYTYNAANLLKSRSDHNGLGDPSKTETYTYDGDKNLKTQTDRNGQITTYTYDSHGRVMSEQIGSITKTYTYDNNHNVVTVSNQTGIITRTFDALDRVLTKNVSDIGIVTFQYDITAHMDEGCIEEKTIDPKGNVTHRIYDRIGRLWKVTVNNQTTLYSYDDNGNRSSIVYPDGSREDYTYYKNNQLKTLMNKKSDGTVLDTYTYSYDKAYNQISKHEIINGIDKGTTTYSYDQLNRVETITEPSGKVTTYSYDTSGNRASETIVDGLTEEITSYTYDNQNRLTDTMTKVNQVPISATSYTYDYNGNQLTTMVTPYLDGIMQEPVETSVHVYDGLNQLIETEMNGTVIRHTYDGEGYRIGKNVNGVQKRYLYDNSQVILELDEFGNQIARNIYGTNLIMRTIEDQSYYYMYNGHSDVTSLLDTTTGTVEATYYYDAFGNITESTGNVDNNITYAGYQYDDETELYYLNARMYNPKIARFLQEDTYLGEPNDPLSLNLYTYCVNNPLIYFDPTGHYVAYMDDSGSSNTYHSYADFRKGEEDSYRGEGLNLYAYVANNPIMYFDPTGHGKDGVNNKDISYFTNQPQPDSDANIIDVNAEIYSFNYLYEEYFTKKPTNFGRKLIHETVLNERFNTRITKEFLSVLNTANLAYDIHNIKGIKDYSGIRDFVIGKYAEKSFNKKIKSFNDKMEWIGFGVKPEVIFVKAIIEEFKEPLNNSKNIKNRSFKAAIEDNPFNLFLIKSKGYRKKFINQKHNIIKDIYDEAGTNLNNDQKYFYYKVMEHISNVINMNEAYDENINRLNTMFKNVKTNYYKEKQEKQTKEYEEFYRKYIKLNPTA